MKHDEMVAFFSELKTGERLTQVALRRAMLAWFDEYPSLDCVDMGDAISTRWDFTDRHRNRVIGIARQYKHERQGAVKLWT